MLSVSFKGQQLTYTILPILFKFRKNFTLIYDIPLYPTTDIQVQKFP
jgi:hypothetical protein